MLSIFQTKIQELLLLQTSWASQLNPLLRSPISKGVLQEAIPLVSGNNVINTLLDRKAQGWFITDINAAVSIYRSAPFNDKTLTLNSSGNAVVNLVIF